MTANSPERGTKTPISDPTAALEYLRQRSLRYQRQATCLWHATTTGCPHGCACQVDELDPLSRAAFVAWWQTDMAPATFRIHR